MVINDETNRIQTLLSKCIKIVDTFFYYGLNGIQVIMTLLLEELKMPIKQFPPKKTLKL